MAGRAQGENSRPKIKEFHMQSERNVPKFACVVFFGLLVRCESCCHTRSILVLIV